MKRILLLSLMLLVIQVDSYACSCVPLKSFCEQSTHLIEWNPEDVIIVRGEVVDIVKVQHRRDLIIQIRESFHNPRSLGMVRIRDGNGADCGQSLDSYRKGDDLIFMTNIYDDDGVTAQFSTCYPGPLVVDKNRVRGTITSTQTEEMSLIKFRNLNCVPTSDHISIFPNPTSDQIHIVSSELSDTSVLEIYLINSMGQRVFQYRPTAEEKLLGSWTIPVRQLPEGTYFLYTVGPSNLGSVTPVVIYHRL